MGLISQKLRNSAKGQACTFQIPGVCCHDPERTVLCHIRDEKKGVGNKADDWSSAFGCDRCHEVIDQHKLPKEQELFYCLRALQRTWSRWIELGLIVVPVSLDKPKTRPKKKTKWPSRKLQSRSNFGPTKDLQRPLQSKEMDYGD